KTIENFAQLDPFMENRVIASRVMKKLIFPILLILALPFAFLGSRVEPLEQRGMSLGLFSKEPNYSYLKDLQELKDLGVNSVLLVVSWYQRDIHSTEILPREYDGNDILTLPDSKLREVIQQAHSLGIQVLIFPILRLEV